MSSITQETWVLLHERLTEAGISPDRARDLCDEVEQAGSAYTTDPVEFAALTPQYATPFRRPKMEQRGGFTLWPTQHERRAFRRFWDDDGRAMVAFGCWVVTALAAFLAIVGIGATPYDYVWTADQPTAWVIDLSIGVPAAIAAAFFARLALYLGLD